MNFNFLSTATFEPWDWTNPDTKGIGGSETSHIEMCNRLAARGHECHSYAPIPDRWRDTGPHGVIWEASEPQMIDWERPGVWVLYRCPEQVTNLPEGAIAWLICQDVDYQLPWSQLNEERLSRFTRIVALCGPHGDYLRKRYPEHAHKVCVSSNGIKPELIRDVLRNPMTRDPNRLLYASSPDRGLIALLDIFARAKEILPTLSLGIAYGFDNIDKVIETGTGKIAQQKKRLILEKSAKTPGVELLGRLGQRALAEEWTRTGIWCHPSEFLETSCITCMEAQALGAIPITNPIWAVQQNVRHGVLIEGRAENDPLVRAYFAEQIVRVATDEALQERIRAEAMPWALERFTWERFVTQWEDWAHADTGTAFRQEVDYLVGTEVAA